MANYPHGLMPKMTEGAQVISLGGFAWRLEIPPGRQGSYRLAQFDDYGSLPRRSFPHTPPFRFSLRARSSAGVLPGTWGFGLWNDPLTMSILRGVERFRLPELPNTAWFFFASPPNYLSLRDDLPAQGCLAAVFHSPRWASRLLALGAPLMPLLVYPPAMRLARRIARLIVRQDAVGLSMDPTAWHTYQLDWSAEGVVLWSDGQVVLQTPISPQGPLGLVIWVDNQYAALPPDGRFRFGTLDNPEPAWMEIADLRVE